MKNIRILLFISLLLTLQSCWNLERINPVCPTLTDITPDGGRFGETITVKGTGFLKGSPELYTVSINGQAIPQADILDVPNEQSLTFRVPKGVSSGRVTVIPRGSTECSANNNLVFTYYYTATMVSLLAGTFNSTSPIPNQTCVTNATDNYLFNPAGLDLDNSSNVVVADKNHNIIRVIKPSASNLSSTGTIVSTHGKVNCAKGCDSAVVFQSAGALFLSPSDIDVDISNDIYVMEESRNATMRLIKASGTNPVEVFAGKCENSNTAIGHRTTTARLNLPLGVFRDGNDLYFTDAGDIRKIDLSSGLVSNFATRAANSYYRGIEISRARPKEGLVFVTDELTKTIKFYTVNTAVGTVTIRNTNTMNNPVALTIDSKGNIYIADQGAHRIFVIYPNGELSVLAGTGTPSYVDNVPGNLAQFNAPIGIALNESLKVIYVSDSKNHVVRTIKLE